MLNLIPYIVLSALGLTIVQSAIQAYRTERRLWRNTVAHSDLRYIAIAERWITKGGGTW